MSWLSKFARKAKKKINIKSVVKAISKSGALDFAKMLPAPAGTLVGLAEKSLNKAGSKKKKSKSKATSTKTSSFYSRRAKYDKYMSKKLR